MTKQTHKYIQHLTRLFLIRDNQPPKTYYGSIMLCKNRGKLILREPKNIRTINLVA
jgi:hypothetical protein